MDEKMLREVWLIALGSLVPCIVALLAGKFLAGKGAIFPVLAGEKLVFFLSTWVFVSAVAVSAYVMASILGMDEETQTTVAGFLVPMFAGAVFVKHRLK
ncbi:hypothetical protein IS481_08490 [Caldimonas thermodepolymerans]|uniref:hypothetical protein n=1 Tax=Caldimonas thermodepolymerans TaxID=215580 RepID=UPI0011AFE608|nr:hypothetical protein [Caldimonas thermodepolymerans]QPC33164.1 hypothetical protein IS481_08490 [Caldimonas thermodepolymerans]